jgi:hypothetical protein
MLEHVAKQLNTNKAKVCRVLRKALKKASNGTLNTPTPFERNTPLHPLHPTRETIEGKAMLNAAPEASCEKVCM